MTKWDVGHYMKFVTDVETQGDRRVYKVGDSFRIDVTTCKHDSRSSNDLINIWARRGYIPAFMPTTLHIATTYMDEKGNSYGRYNIMEKVEKLPTPDLQDEDVRLIKARGYGSGFRHIINFAAIREATRKNEEELVAECIKLWAEDGHVKELPLVGRVRFIDGSQIEYTDAEEYIKAVKEELPDRPTTGFEFQTLTKDPAVRKAVDDEICNLYGEKNLRRLEDYQDQAGEDRTMETEAPELEDEELEL